MNTAIAATTSGFRCSPVGLGAFWGGGLVGILLPSPDAVPQRRISVVALVGAISLAAKVESEPIEFGWTSALLLRFTQPIPQYRRSSPSGLAHPPPTLSVGARSVSCDHSMHGPVR